MPTREAAGFTLIEMMIAITVIGVLLAIGADALRTYRESTLVREAAEVLAAEMIVTRSAAIKRRGNVSLVADESELSYVIRADDGEEVRGRRSFDADSDIPLDRLDVAASGDSLTFDSRGLLVSGVNARIDVGRPDRTLRVEFNALGRHRIVTP